MAKEKVIIIGGGVIGLCTAYYLNQKGYEVTVLDKGKFDEGCSFGNAGMIVPSHFVPLAQPGMIAKGIRWMFNQESPFYIRPRPSLELINWGIKFYRHSTRKHVQNSARLLADLNLKSKKLYKDLQEKLGDFGLKNKGLIMLCKTKKGFEEEKQLAEHAHQLNMKAEILDGDGLHTLDPGITMDVAGGVYFPEDAFFDPGLFMSTLINKLKISGVEFIENKNVTDCNIDGNLVKDVKCNEEYLSADYFVLAAGSWSGLVAKKLRLSIPLLAGKGYSFTIPQPVETPEICSILTEAKVAVTPMSGGLRFAGTMEVGELDNSINEKRVAGIKKSIPGYFPKFDLSQFEGQEIWSGFRPVSPDGLPYLGKSKKFSNLIIATGHGMMGMSLGPVTGWLVEEIISNGMSEINVEKLSPDRFN